VTNLSVFNGSNPNGTWFLYAIDDTFLDAGAVSNGWALNFITANSVIGSSDLVLGITNSNAVTLLSNITYYISVTNSGPAPATNVSITALWPTNAAFVSAAGGGYVSNNNFVSFTNLGTLAKDGVASVTVVLQAKALGAFTNTAIASTGSIDPNTQNNTRTA